MTDILKTTRGDLMNLSKQLQNINNAQRKEIGELKGRVTQMENKAKSAPTVGAESISLFSEGG